MNLQSVKQRYGIIGRSPGLDRALHTALQVANTSLTVLITGESGVGKEAVSKIIHDYSARKHEGFIAINCGAIPAGTINSELFGHEKGAFTGATGDRKGYFETYDGGTIFLDEIGEMPLDTQSYLLRVLETGEFIRVGSSKTQRTDVRIIAATNVNLMQRVKKNKFREDLYYRLNTVPIQLPPLRERREDINLIFRKFASDFSEKYRSEPIRLDESARQILKNYSWPGNIRELRNIAEQLSVLVDEDHKLLNAEMLVEIIPRLKERNLPAKNMSAEEMARMDERKIFYLMIDMKKDINDLKALVHGLIQGNDLQVPNMNSTISQSIPATILDNYMDNQEIMPEIKPTFSTSSMESFKREDRQQMFYSPTEEDEDEDYDTAVVVDENLSLQDAEKDLIIRALKKHNGRRKDASADLGISERTLYRKIKEYEL